MDNVLNNQCKSNKALDHTGWELWQVRDLDQNCDFQSVPKSNIIRVEHIITEYWPTFRDSLMN